LNLNPYEVLQIEPESPIEAIKKRYRMFSILVHPDKKQDNKERAQTAFDIINRAWKTLENEVTRKKCIAVYEKAKERTDYMVKRGRANEIEVLQYIFSFIITDS
jgi:DnaJ homolog subfamily C member 8